MDPRIKKNGRAVIALRWGLRAARDELLAMGNREGAEAATRALKRAERMERG